MVSLPTWKGCRWNVVSFPSTTPGLRMVSLPTHADALEGRRWASGRVFEVKPDCQIQSNLRRDCFWFRGRAVAVLGEKEASGERRSPSPARVNARGTPG
jgi:hypothetical protein